MVSQFIFSFDFWGQKFIHRRLKIKLFEIIYFLLKQLSMFVAFWEFFSRGINWNKQIVNAYHFSLHFCWIARRRWASHFSGETRTYKINEYLCSFIYSDCKCDLNLNLNLNWAQLNINWICTFACQSLSIYPKQFLYNSHKSKFEKEHKMQLQVHETEL